MPTRDLANKRVSLWVGPLSSIANYLAPLQTEIAAMLMISDAVRWSGYDLGVKASANVDDRSLSDDAASTLIGFAQFGGGLPLFTPKVTDTTSILRLAYNLLKVDRTPLYVVERIGFKSTSAAIAAGDNVNVYAVITDGYENDTAGDGGYAYVLQLLSQGTVAPWTVVAATSPVVPTIVGGSTLSLSLAGVNVGLRGFDYQGNHMANRAAWLSSNPAIATVDNHGVIVGRAIGTCNVTPSFPGAGAVAAPIAVTVAA